ncbi:hypothetical protein Tco_0090878 [Tanacetum coccineum]
MSEESGVVDVVVVPKFDMQCHESLMTAKDVKNLVRKYNVPLDLHPCAPTEGWTMDQLPEDHIGLYEQFFEFSGLRVPFSTLHLGVIRHFRVHISQLVPLRLNRLTMFEMYCRSLGKYAGGKIFNETFSGMKGWKDRFFFIDRRAIPDAMAWRHHDSDVSDAFSNNDFSIQDVQSLTKKIIDLRPVPPGILFGVGLATTWDCPGFFPVFKDTGRNVVTKHFEYLRFPTSFRSVDFTLWHKGVANPDQNYQHSGAAIPTNHLVGQNTTPPLPVGQPIPDKIDSQREVEVEDPKVVAAKEKKRAQVARDAAKKKDRKRGNDERDGNDGEPNILNDGNRSASHSPHGSVSESVHHFVNIEEKRDQESPPHVEPFVNLSGQPIHPTKEPVFLSKTNADRSSHPLKNLSTGDPASQPREILTGRNIEEVMPRTNGAPGSSGRSGGVQCFNQRGGAPKGLEAVRKLVDARLDLEHNDKLYTDAMSHYKTVKEEHAGCVQRIQILENEKNYLSAANHDQAARIHALEAELAKKDSALTYVERMVDEGNKEREKLTTQLSPAEIERFDCIRKLLPTIVSRLLQSHEYKQSLSEPFNMAIQAGWGKGLSEVRTEEQIMSALSRVKNFDAYSDRKLYPMYDGLFKKEYPYVKKIASGFRHSVADLLKIHHGPALSRGTSAPTISKALDGSSHPSNKKI